VFEEIRHATAEGQGEVKALCALTGASRATYYRSRQRRPASAAAMEVRDEMQRIALEFPAYGYRRITAELRRRNVEVNHKRVLRMMREDNLLSLRRKSFLVTTDSRHPLPVYPNVAQGMTPEAVNQLRVADITYIRLLVEFVYLAVILDAYSRRVIGWHWAVRWKPNWRCRPCAWR
jgi:transposase InsO family protein